MADRPVAICRWWVENAPVGVPRSAQRRLQAWQGADITAYQRSLPASIDRCSVMFSKQADEALTGQTRWSSL